MNRTYTCKQAMERLGIKSRNAFHAMEKKYPEAFVIVNQDKSGNKHPLYDSTKLDKFAQQRECFKRVASRQFIS